MKASSLDREIDEKVLFEEVEFDDDSPLKPKKLQSPQK